MHSLCEDDNVCKSNERKAQRQRAEQIVDRKVSAQLSRRAFFSYIFVEVIKMLKRFFLFKMKEIDISRLMKFLHIDCSTRCVCYRLIA